VFHRLGNSTCPVAVAQHGKWGGRGHGGHHFLVAHRVDTGEQVRCRREKGVVPFEPLKHTSGAWSAARLGGAIEIVVALAPEKIVCLFDAARRIT